MCYETNDIATRMAEKSAGFTTGTKQRNRDNQLLKRDKFRHFRKDFYDKVGRECWEKSSSEHSSDCW